jgi:ATP-dependent DNA ligase
MACEIMHDGCSLIIQREDKRVPLFTRNGHDWSVREAFEKSIEKTIKPTSKPLAVPSRHSGKQAFS